MLAEFLNALVGHVRASDKVEIVPLPDDPRHVLVRNGRDVEERALPAPLRKHKIASFPDFVRAVLDKVICPTPEVYFGIQGAVAYCDRLDRREAVTLPLALSQRWRAVESLEKSQPMLPKEAIQFLRFELSCPSAEPIIQSLRRIDFTRTSTGGNVTQHGRESLGRSVEAAVQQADQIPEAFDLTVMPLTNNGFQQLQVTVRVGVTIDLEQQRINFRLLADELANARETILSRFGAMLAEALPEVPAFNGSAA